MTPFKNALISVSDKSGLADLAGVLLSQGTRVVSTGGTAEFLKKAGLNVVDIQNQTGFPEVMGGRVKTLHPNVHMALLSRSWEAGDQEILAGHGLEPFDLVIVNLYPFAEAVKTQRSERDQIEFIDIGGPSMLRSAAKSFERITVLSDPSDYGLVAGGIPSLERRRELAAKVFALASTYDALVAKYLGANLGDPNWALAGSLKQMLRYGENPHQRASWYELGGNEPGLQHARVLQGKELSYNNLLDLDAAMRLAFEFGDPVCVVVKHNNPCGVATSEALTLAVEQALKADPVSAFGGVVAFNRAIDIPEAMLLVSLFLECIIAPQVSPAAQEIFKKKPNLRVLEWNQWRAPNPELKVRSILGGFLVQNSDHVGLWSNEWKVHGQEVRPTVRSDLSLAWRVCGHLRSNAIALAGAGHTVGLGMGQVNRIDAVQHAIERWKRFHPGVRQVVAASDAFFPFADSIDLLARAGVEFVIQPGGSVKDEEVLARAKEMGLTLVLTGERHFVH